MLSFILTAFLSVGLAAGREISVCSENEEFLNCGTACAPTCLSLNSSQPIRCVDLCISGCFCQEGFVRDGLQENRCVPVSNCPSVIKCPKNEIYTECGTLCPLVCGDSSPKLCPDICVKGCVCQEGYIRSKDGACIPEETCDIGVKKICSDHQEYKKCGSACPGTCTQPLRVCDQHCVHGCFCEKGYVLDDDTKACVKIEDCPNHFV